MVRNIAKIYKRDMKVIFTNYAVLITVIALCILPSLYAWINIKASWDPYSSQATGRIKVAVVNNDKGTTLNEKAVNIGDKVVEGLKDNDLLGWQFVDQNTATEDLRLGKIYAMIVIPENFSSDITSLVTDNIRSATLTYIVNEKLNAIAPKITVKGASGIQSTVSEEVISTVSSTVLEMAKDLGVEVEDVILPKLVEVGQTLQDVEGRFTQINDLITKADEDIISFSTFLDDVVEEIPKIEKLIVNTQDMISTIDAFMNNLEIGLDGLAPTIKNDIALVSEISGELNGHIEALRNLIEAGSPEAAKAVDNMLTKIEGLDRLASSLTKLLTGINNVAGSDLLAGRIERLNNLQAKLNTTQGYLQQIRDKLASNDTVEPSLLDKASTVLQDVNGISKELYDNFDTEIVNGIKGVFNAVNGILENGNTALTEVNNALPNVTELINNVDGIMARGSEGLEKIKEVMPTIEEKVRALSDKVDKINQSQELKDILSMLRENVASRTEFLSNGIQIKQETIFPMGNYGSQMAPFYSVLAAWVGLTILVSMLSVEAEGNYKSYEVYFGKLLTYLSITIVQGLVIGLGDLYILRIYCTNPWLFMIGIVLSAITFTFIVYSLVSVFGNVGKVIAIILMIIQVAGSGGTFPVQLTSNFFISVNPYLPFTYGISFLREAIGGVEQSILTRDIWMLVLFIVGSVVISLVLKKYVNKLLEGFVHKVHEGGL